MKQHFVFWNDRQMTPERLSAFHCRSGRSGCHSVVPMSFQNVLSEHKRQRNDRRPPGKSGVGYLHGDPTRGSLLPVGNQEGGDWRVAGEKMAGYLKLLKTFHLV